MNDVQKKLLTPIVFAFAIVMLCSCKKNSIEESLPDSSNKALESKINRWLDRQKIGSVVSSTVGSMSVKPRPALTESNKNANIDLLKSNLRYNSVRREPQSDRNSYIIVPIDDNIKNRKSLNPNATLNLFLIVDRADSVIGGYISYYEPADKKQRGQLSANTFHNIFNNKPITDDGKYHFMTVSGTRQYTIEYKDHKPYSFSSPRAKPKGNSPTKALSMVCIDWYLVTTYYYPNGNSEVTEEYLGTTCEGCDDPAYMNLCPGGDNGGAGGGGEQTDTTFNVTDQESFEGTSEAIDPGPEDEGGPQSPDGVGGGFNRIMYSYYDQKVYETLNGVNVGLAGVNCIPTKVWPAQSEFLSPIWGPGIRKLTPYGFWEGTPMRTSPISFWCTWNTYVLAEYRYTNYPWATRNWLNTYSKNVTM